MCNFALAFELYHLSCRQSTLFQTLCGGGKDGVLWLTANLPTTSSCSEAGTGMAAVTRIESATSVLGFSALGVDWWTMSWTICELICTNLSVSSPFMHFGDLHQVCQAPANMFHDCAQENNTHQDKLYSSCQQYRDYKCFWAAYLFWRHLAVVWVVSPRVAASLLGLAIGASTWNKTKQAHLRTSGPTKASQLQHIDQHPIWGLQAYFG